MNMYKSKLVACIKRDGKICKENKEAVRIPFGSEFSIFLKNLNTRRASVKIEIDGNDVLDGTSLIIDAASELNLERFIKNGNLEKGNRFKFIERNSKVEAARGIGAEDGLIRIEFQFERDLVIGKHYQYPWPTYWNCSSSYGNPNSYGSGSYNSELYSSSLEKSIGDNTVICRSMSAKSTSGAAAPPPNTVTQGNTQVFHNTVNDAGITAPGSVSDQQFTTVAPLLLDSEKHVIVLKLLGETESGKKIEKPITVKSKNKCSICSRLNKATAKFCSDCGAGLEIVA